MIKIITADDHPFVRDGIRHLIEETDDMIVKDEAGTGKEVLFLVSKRKYDILILDLCLPDMDGKEVLQKIRENNNKIPVLILSMLPRVPYALNLIEAGANGYLNKMNVSDLLLASIREILFEGKIVNPEIV